MSTGKDKTSCDKKVEYLYEDPTEKAKADKALEEISRDGKVKYEVSQTAGSCKLIAATKEDVDKAAEKYYELRNYGGTQNETEEQHTTENTFKETIDHQSTTSNGKTVENTDKYPKDQSVCTIKGKGSHHGKKENELEQEGKEDDIPKEADSEKKINLEDESERSVKKTDFSQTKYEKSENVDDISDNVSSDVGKSTNADDMKNDNHESRATKGTEKEIQERDAEVDDGKSQENQHKNKVASGKENDANLSSNLAVKSEKTSAKVVEIISHGFKIKLYQQNLLETDVDAIVNAANETLSHGAGIAKIIADNAGPKLIKECQDYIKKMKHLPVTKTLTTGPGKLKYKKIIHVVGPAWSDYSKKEDCLSDLAKTITNLLEEAKRCKLKTVAMPTISSGIFRVPKCMCAAMYLKGVFTFSEQKKFGSLKELHIVDLTSEVLDLIEEKYQTYLSKENTLDPKGLLAIYDEENIKLEKGSSNSAQTQKVPQTNTNEKNTDKIQNSSNSNTGTLMQSAQSKCFKKTINNVRIHIYTHDIKCLQDIDIAVSSENPYFTGTGGIAATLLSTGGKEYAKEHDKLRRSAPFPRYSTKITPGYNTNFKEICHAVVVAFSRNNPLTRDGYNRYTWFIRDILNELNRITEHSVKFKHKEGFCSIVLPLLGAGKLQDPNSIQILCSLMVEGIESYACYRRKHINHIHLVNMREEFTKLLIAACNKTNPERSVNEASVKSIRFDSRPFEFLYSWKIPPVREQVDIKDFINPTDGQRDGVCIICLDDLSKPVELMRCHHCFCRECISGFFSEKPACPVCNTVYGKIYGLQPLNGEAKIFKDKRSLQGYPKTDTLIISYEFPNGNQEECHPEPGKPYIGIQRQAYLPNTDEGKEVLHLLEQAFKQRLVFTIGLSRTTGKDGVMTWNDIHHKTSREGGPERFGYPDSEYLSRVKEELSGKGITQA